VGIQNVILLDLLANSVIYKYTTGNSKKISSRKNSGPGCKSVKQYYKKQLGTYSTRNHVLHHSDLLSGYVSYKLKVYKYFIYKTDEYEFCVFLRKHFPPFGLYNYSVTMRY